MVHNSAFNIEITLKLRYLTKPCRKFGNVADVVVLLRSANNLALHFASSAHHYANRKTLSAPTDPPNIYSLSSVI